MLQQSETRHKFNCWCSFHFRSAHISNCSKMYCTNYVVIDNLCLIISDFNLNNQIFHSHLRINAMLFFLIISTLPSILHFLLISCFYFFSYLFYFLNFFHKTVFFLSLLTFLPKSLSHYNVIHAFVLLFVVHPRHSSSSIKSFQLIFFQNLSSLTLFLFLFLLLFFIKTTYWKVHIDIHFLFIYTFGFLLSHSTCTHPLVFYFSHLLSLFLFLSFLFFLIKTLDKTHIDIPLNMSSDYHSYLSNLFVHRQHILHNRLCSWNKPF